MLWIENFFKMHVAAYESVQLQFEFSIHFSVVFILVFVVQMKHR